MPQLWQLTQTLHSRVFTNQTIPDIIRDVLEDSGLGSGDYVFKLAGQYPVEEHVCQYLESNFDFIERLMNDNLFFLVFLVIFFKNLMTNVEVFFEIFFLNFFIDIFDKFGFKGDKGSCGFSGVEVLFEFLIIFRYGIELLLKLMVG